MTEAQDFNNRLTHNGKYILGVDGASVNVRQPKTVAIDWAKIASYGVKFAFWRITIGINPDKSFVANVTAINLELDSSDNEFILRVTVKNPTVLLPPVADTGGPYSGDEGSVITVDASGSSDPDGAHGKL